MRWVVACCGIVMAVVGFGTGAAAQGTIPPNPGDVVNCGDFATWDEANDWFWTHHPHHGDVARLDGDGDLIPCSALPGAPDEPRPPTPTRCRDDAELVPSPTGDLVPDLRRGFVGGYVLLEANGTAHVFGPGLEHGMAGVDAIDLALLPSGGQLVLACDGRVIAVGDATARGDLDPVTLADDEHPAAIMATPDGDGYWVVSDRGRVTPFGTAGDHGDLWSVAPGSIALADVLNEPIIAATPTPSGDGYYLVGADGGVFTFGDAGFHGSTGGLTLNEPVVAVAADPDGSGYWLFAADGGVFAFDAPFRGSVPGALAPSTALNAPVVGGIGFGDGYLLVASDGGAFTFSDQPFLGSLGGTPTAEPIVAVAALTPFDALVAGLVVDGSEPDEPYQRSDWPHWSDADGDCQTTRFEVLIEESTVEPTLSDDGCTVVAGRWVDPFTGIVVTDPGGLDVDHLVPLADAHASGGWAWDREMRRAFANDLDHDEALVAVTRSANRSKGSRGPDEWRPPATEFWCEYGTGWAEVKSRWALSVTEAERIALLELRATC
ncbi:MAG: HNH endonuclease family protein [Actinomycetota bacterium]